MKTLEDRLFSPDVPFAKYYCKNNTRHFHLTAEPIRHKILNNLAIDALGYNCSTPGPVIVIKQGECINITVENGLDEPTALHVHGLSKPNSQDGAPDIEPCTPKIMPGDSFTYKFIAWQAGTFFYHSTMEQQAAQGLIGAFIVLPASENDPNFSLPYGDYVLVLQQWEIPQPALGKVTPGLYKPNIFDRNPNFFTINGKAFPDTTPLYTKCGEIIKIRFINKSSNSHSMHIHGHDFTVVAVDGFQRLEFDDTIDVASGRRIEIELLTNNPGIWPINGTKTFHQSNNGVSPGGMITRLIYEK
ncbi:multicopper oxidase domain-containing protein [Clostridium beijerinckii]|uniref:multicopper oxidase family protein n=1 Tax=Clostridium beijerinckii TaxID=1520 RepID=UPI0015705783|nr:multicopper oxidase domain-containing protein [Clostridium beijerinckii]NRT35524.1 FtsP/CotA-like multicopper oxidase with cupredoxin domain [Clostridium beijerinckii]NRT45048.1 FtsP/CotA-like multicopper oxidase with cupredoxin domain [Clostridium beijerinckii]NRZ20956.1 FtsP/CotA-like multicopper oxidase with cupredoxin domain [Clostridium beijerinckii]UYZ38164.1 multicopper oxidase domain-containing protein [Clostridium beijerinckii]